MNLDSVITRLDVIASERYPVITDYDIEALKIAMSIVKEKKEFEEHLGNKSSNNEHWIDNAYSYICPKCGFETNNPSKYDGCKCPKCGFQDEKDKRQYV